MREMIFCLLLSGCTMTAEQAAQLNALDGCAVVADKPERIAVYSGKAARAAAERARTIEIERRR